VSEALLRSGVAMGTQAGAARGDRLSLRIGRESDGWNAASSIGHEQAVGSGQPLRFVAIPPRKPAAVGAAAPTALLRRESFGGSLSWAVSILGLGIT
jgi:hypothetical protein